MTLRPDQMLLHYRLIEKIGEGGMGVVWRAADTTLDREVAIKVLPDAFLADAGRLARFEREAKVLASLNHPNIASIHGLHEAGSVRFLAMELVTGVNLSQHLAQGAPPLDESLRMAGQIAEALEAAHANGVVHRDLKPANIQIASDGKVKVLDFGLAKLPEATGSSANLSVSPTVTSGGTLAGTILGTAAYMSPEQARGRSVDKQTDIWAFGCVLYEILTGRQAFRGQTVSDVLARVLEREPDWDRLPSNTPLGVKNLLRRCLWKDTRERLHDIADARIQISDACDPEATKPATSPLPARSPVGVVLGVLVGLLIGATLWFLVPQRTHEHGVRRFSIAVPQGIQVLGQSLVVPAFALSPDGQSFVYVGYQGGYRRLFRRELNDFRTTPIPGTTGAQGPTISPDGRWVAFLADGALKKVPIAGGPMTTLSDASPWRAPTWGPDDTIVFSPGGKGIFRVPAAGTGQPQAAVSLGDAEQNEHGYGLARILPDGDTILFSIQSEDSEQIATQSLSTGERQVLAQGRDANVTSSGQILFLLGDVLWAARFDTGRRQMNSEPIEVLRGVASYALAEDGTLVYSRSVNQELVLVNHDGQVTKVLDSGPGFYHPRVSPDGNHVAVTNPAWEIWVFDIRRGTKSRLIRDADDPVWFPGSDEIAFSSIKAEGFNVLSRAADGSGEPRSLVSRERLDFPKALTSDAEVMVFSSFSAGPADISLVNLEERSAVTDLLAEPNDEREPALSPDDRWIAYVSNESGRDEVYVQKFPRLGNKAPISVVGGTAPCWSPDGRTIFYRQGTSVMAVDVDADQVLAAGVPRKLFDGAFIAGRGRNYDVTPDGKQFVMVRMIEDAPAGFSVIVNWQEELDDLLASGQ